MAVSSTIQIFINLLTAYMVKYFSQEFDSSLKPIDSADCMECRNTIYDFIIVGAGSAGSVLAHRLSENRNWNILLIEAGDDESYLTDVPAFCPLLSNTRYDWNYTSVQQKRACLSENGYCVYPRGHVMGGSSTINYMFYVRGNRADYDEWEHMGNPGWGYKDILKYFLKLENMTIPELAASPLHSTLGPQTVAYGKYRASIIKDAVQAGVDYGLKVKDYNGVSQNGINFVQSSTDGVTRASTSKCYLNPIRERKNLRIFKNTLVTKVLINKSTRTAVGVRCLTSGQQYDVFASKEVILSAGAINTPKLLMLSGIGPSKHLTGNNIPVIVNLPVGDNLHDHYFVTLPFKQGRYSEDCDKQYGDEVAYNYAKNRQGELTTFNSEAEAFLNSWQAVNQPPDLQLLFGINNFIFSFYPGSCFFIGVANIRVKSRGTVRLNSNSPFDRPLIDPKFNENEDDLHVTRSGIEQALKLIEHPVMSKYNLTFLFNESCTGITDRTDFLNCIIEYQSIPYYHAAGTTKMGSILDKTTVVNSELKVHNVNKLRVVDAGIMPRLPRGNTNAPTIMIAEKASDIIKESYGVLT